MKKNGIMIKIGFKNAEETVYFCTELGDKEIREDIKQRIRSVLQDEFGKYAKQYTYTEMVERINKQCNQIDMLRIYERIARKFQHSNMWDIVSDLRIDQEIGTSVWILINAVQNKIVIQDVNNDFRDLMDDIVGSKKVAVKKLTVKEMKMKADKVRNELEKRLHNNGYTNYYEGLVKQNPFVYNGEQFIPIFDCIVKSSFDYISKWISCNPKEDKTFRGKAYNYNDFIKADEKVNKESKADIYLCFTDNKLYVPSNRTLFEFFDKRAFFKG